MKVRPTVVIVHFRRMGVKNDRPWTVHCRGKCIPAKSVIFHVPTETVFKPQKRSNPRAWIRTVGLVDVDADGIVTIR